MLVIDLTEIAGISWSDLKIFHLFYDFQNDTIIYRSEDKGGVYFPYDDGKTLFCEFVNEGRRVHWYFEETKSRNIIENALTKKLTDHQIDMYLESISFHIEKKLLLGFTNVDGNILFKSVNWNKTFENVNVVPLTIQMPEELSTNNNFKFSGDGNWIKTSGEINQDDNLTQPTNIIFYSVNKSYPNNISLPVVGGPTSEKACDAYINHTTLGPIHINLFKGSLFSYKMNDVIKVLAEKAKKM